MKLTFKQEEQLKKYFSGIFLYRETYFEVLDHMFCALERMDSAVNFQNAVNGIINEDFGGHNKLRTLDADARKLAFMEGKHRYWKYFKDGFKGINAALMILLGITFYVLNVPALINNDVTYHLLLPAVGISGAMEIYRYFKQGVVFRSLKRSAKDGLFSMLSGIPVRLYLAAIMFRLIDQHSNLGVPHQANAFIVALLLVMWVAYIRAFAKMYRDEFKVAAK